MMHIPALSKTTVKLRGLKFPFINIPFKKNSCSYYIYIYIYIHIHIYKTQLVIMIANSKIEENWIIFFGPGGFLKNQLKQIALPVNTRNHSRVQNNT